jgi:hypothetical protein
MKSNHKINIHEYIKKKLKYLRKDSLYDYSFFSSILNENPIAFRKAISRLAKEGVIVKLGNGKFYKRGERASSMVFDNALDIKARKKAWLRKGSVPSVYLKSALSFNFFWSNPKGHISIDTIIVAIIENNALSDLDFARFSFGDKRVVEIFLKNFNIHSRPMIRDLLYV